MIAPQVLCAGRRAARHCTARSHYSRWPGLAPSRGALGNKVSSCSLRSHGQNRVLFCSEGSLTCLESEGH